jgi:amidophosphoribosyltransferase
MSEPIQHECGIALLRLLKPLEFYLAKYGTGFYALNKMHLMMQKQHNRGQDGAGIANIKIECEAGYALHQPPTFKFLNAYHRCF